jgi:hypothetical protein
MGNGCGSAPEPDKQPEPASPPAPAVFRLDEPIKVSLHPLLSRPRQELAAQAEQLAEQIQFQEKKNRDGLMPFVLLPDFHLVRAVPIFGTAKFSADHQLSLPPYFPKSGKDNEVALHLARFGDVEGALRIVDKNDAATRARIESFRLGRNYPVEWTRLVALYLDDAHIRLATGDHQAGRDLVGLHKQLREVLDTKAQSSWLGAVLLPRGRAALSQAAAAWSKANQAALAEQAEAAVTTWEGVPEFQPLLPLGTKRADVARFLASPATGYAVKAANLARAFDLLALPFPAEGAETVVACFDRTHRLANLVVVYYPSVTESFARPEQLAQLVEERGLHPQQLPEVAGLHRRSYRAGETAWEVAVVPNHGSVGALVTLGATRPSHKCPSLSRDFGVVRFDRSFEQNRIRFTPHQRGRRITARDPQTLDRLVNPLRPLGLTGAEIQADPQETLLAQLTLTFAADPRSPATFGQTALPLWAAAGPGRLETGKDQDTAYLALRWEDGPTRYTFRWPYGQGQPPVFVAQDQTPAAELAARTVRVLAADRAERKARFKKHELITWIAHVRERVALGMSRAEVDNVLPRPRTIIKRDIPDGLAVIFKEAPEDNPGYIPRELFARFGSDQRVAEIRVRYTGNVGNLLEELRISCGAPWQSPGPWARVWTKEFASRSPDPVLYRWQDDATLLTFQQDSEGVELTLRDCPRAYESGVPLPPFECLPPGPKNCRLDTKKADLVKRWKDSRPRFQEGWLVLSLPEDSPFDQYLVRFNAHNRAVQVSARHRQQWDREPSPDELAAAVQKAWARNVRDYGWPRREETNARKQFKSWTNHDDRTRLTIFWEESRSGKFRLFTEWTNLEASK